MARLLEHHALEILQKSGIPVPSFEVVSTHDAAEKAVTHMGGPVVLKALIPVGGTGSRALSWQRQSVRVTAT